MTTSTLPLSKRFVFGAVLVMFGVGLGLCLLEVTVRIFFPTTDFLWQSDPVTGMKLVPGKHGRSVKPGLFDVDVEVNQTGFRDREHSIQKPNGVKRIVLLGDSFLEAIQVPFDRSITARLQDRLNSTTGPVELINLGVSGAGTAREYLSLQEYGLQYKPDLVLLFFVGNDISDNSKRLQGLSYIPYPQVTADGRLARDTSGRPLFTPFNDQSSRLSSLIGPVKDHVKSFRFVREAIDNSPRVNQILYRLRLISTPPETVNTLSDDNFGFYEIYRPQLRPAWAEAWQLTEDLLLAGRDLAEANNSQFAVVLIPASWEVNGGTWEEVLTGLPAMRETPLNLDLPSQRLVTFLTANGIRVMNLLPEFRTQAASSPPLYLRGDAHWTAAGHQLAADLLAKPVAEMIVSEPQLAKARR